MNMNRHYQRAITIALLLLLVFGLSAIGREIHIPADAPLAGTVLIAESFYKTVDGDQIPLELQIWQGGNGVGTTDWFDERIEAHPGDVIVLAPGQYKADIWILTPRLTVTTDPAVTEMADIWGTVEVDADAVILDRIAVTGPRKNMSSGHGIEINRELLDHIVIRNCLVEGNEWMGIHVIGPRGEISELRVENCEIRNNGSFGLEVQGVDHLIATGCTITANDQGIHIGSNVNQVTLENNTVTGNRSTNIFRKE